MSFICSYRNGRVNKKLEDFIDRAVKNIEPACGFIAYKGHSNNPRSWVAGPAYLGAGGHEQTIDRIERTVAELRGDPDD